MTGTERLREQLDAMQASLRAFDAPVVDEHPGLRLMAETLREREEHIRGQISKNERCTITLQLAGCGIDGAVPAGLVGALLAAVDTAVNVVAAIELAAWDPAPPASTAASAAALHLRQLQIDDDDVTLTLTRPPGSLDAQLAHPTAGAPFAEQVMSLLTDVVATAVNGDTADAPDDLRPALQSLADLIVTTGTVLRWRLEPHVLEARDVSIDQAAAQRIVQSTA